MAFLEKLISIVTPHKCLVCGTEGRLVCHYCEPDLCLSLPPHCYRCNAMTIDNAVCAKCHRISPLGHVWMASDYSSHSKQLIYSLKFDGAQAAATVMSRAMQDALPYLEDVVLVPVPTATSRARKRGYDQAKLLTKGLAHLTNLPIQSLLGRLGQTRQVGTKKYQREAQLKEAFWPLSPARTRGARIILVDDVITTGASLEQAARVLRQAGAKTVDAVVFAQKQ